MERRDFFKSLIAAGATVKERKKHRNRRSRHESERIYHGPMAIPERIALIIAEHPAIKRTTHRHIVSRYAGDLDGWVWLFRCQIPAHRLMVGEIIRTTEGKIRVHCWSSADPERYTRGDDPQQIVRAKSTIESPDHYCADTPR